jgi:serine/threonine protein kinase
MGNCWSGIIGLLERCTKPQYEPIEERRSKLNAELSANPISVDLDGRGAKQQQSNENGGVAGGGNISYQASSATSSGDPSASTAASTPSGFFYKYELKNEIGVGSTSKCFRCVRKSDGMVFACKVIDKSNIEAKFSGLLGQFLTEIKVLKALRHENIIHLEDDFETSDRIYLVMEMMSGGELFDYVVAKGTLSEEEASELVRKICSAVAHMHANNIIHRDLKPENLLLTASGKDAQVKLIDFGLAKVMQEDTARSFLGTKGYLAPEMLQRSNYDKSVDMWSLGVIAFVLLCGCLPFDDDSSRIISESAARKKFALRFPRWATTLSASAKDLLYNLLDVDPKTRYTADQALNHPWVSGRTVQPNSYLASPSLLGERRKDARTANAIKARLDNIRSEMEKEGKEGKEGKGRQRKNSF